MPKKMNALKTGLYARETVLSWENAEAYETLRTEILADLQPQDTLEIEVAANIAENRWMRRRVQRSSAIDAHRHPFGLMLEESGAKSWSEALKVVRNAHADHHNTLERIANSTQKIAQQTANWTTSDELQDLAEKVVAQCETIIGCLTRIDAALDEEADFFREHTPKHLRKRIGVENQLDAQFDKELARLTIMREARILREKLRGSQDAAGDSAVERSHNDVDAACKSPNGGQEFDFAELDRDDVGESVEERPSADRGGRPDSATAHRNHDAVDPLLEFIGASPTRDDGEASDSAEAEPDDDDTDDWGEPKTRSR